MTDKQKIENWLDKQIKLINYQNRINDLKINKSLTLSTCTCGTEVYILLYRCIQKIADILELPINSEILDLSSGEKALQLSFMYHGVKFIQIGEDEK